MSVAISSKSAKVRDAGDGIPVEHIELFLTHGLIKCTVA